MICSLMPRMLALAVILALSSGSAVQTQSPAKPAPPPSVRLYVFDGGTLESDPARYQLTKEDVGVTQLSIGAYLIAHPRGVLMWDAGAVADADWKPAGKPVEHRLQLLDGQERRVTLRTPLLAQLSSIGYRPSDITHLALSHYHWDHTGNANTFASATWLVRQIERDAMFEKPGGTTRPMSYSALAKSKTTIVTVEEHDVFGDGTVILKNAPGHTPGHQVLYVKLARTGGVVLSGDLYHYPQERTMDRYPTFEFDVAQTRAARRDLDAFLKKTGAQLWIQHDFQADAKLKKAPAFYD
jgi:N-acyl homoserine lactone hydrolase